MSFPTASRRPTRVVAAALLLTLHLVAISLFVGLRTTREHAVERLATLLLLAAPRPATPAAPAPARAAAPARPRTRPAPTPPSPLLDLQAPRGIHDSSAALTAPDGAGAPSGSAPAGPAVAPLNLAIPKEFYTHPPALTPAQEAMRDPRSNRLVLTKQEQMDVDFGVVECIAWQREPDGSIYRGPGRWRRIQGISTNPFTSHQPGGEDRSQECVK